MAEYSTKPIQKWDPNLAVEMARSVKERHGARPYGFQFSTRVRGPKDLDSKVTKQSRMYYLGGTIMTVKQIEALKDPGNDILLSNMRGNGWKQVIVNTNSWKWVQPFEKGDVLLDVTL